MSEMVVMQETLVQVEAPSQSRCEATFVQELGEQSNAFVRIDEEMLATLPPDSNSNAVHGSLKQEGMIERFEVYHKVGCEEIAVVVLVGQQLCGHKGLVHGGIISTIFDNAFGWHFVAGKEAPAFTANLSVNFRQPVKADSVCIVRVQVDSDVGRKKSMTARWESLGGDLLADATALFIRPKTASA